MAKLEELFKSVFALVIIIFIGGAITNTLKPDLMGGFISVAIIVSIIGIIANILEKLGLIR